MKVEAVLDVIVKVLVALGGLTGVGAFFMVRSQKRKLVADTDKTEAEADSVVADAQQKRTAREISLIEPYERMHVRMAAELDDLYAEVDRLKEYIQTLAQVIRGAGVEVPPMPRKRDTKNGDNLTTHVEKP